MLKQFIFVMKFVVIGIIYIVLFRIIRAMYLDLKGTKSRDSGYSYALEIQDAPDSIGIRKGSVYPVHITTNIGRKNDNHISIDDPFISSNHASVFIEDGKLYIKDLNSTNGTFKNGAKIKDIEELADGDIIEIGRVLFKVIG